MDDVEVKWTMLKVDDVKVDDVFKSGQCLRGKVDDVAMNNLIVFSISGRSI